MNIRPHSWEGVSYPFDTILAKGRQRRASQGRLESTRPAGRCDAFLRPSVTNDHAGWRALNIRTVVMKVLMSVAIMAVALSVMHAASAAGSVPLPLPAPPPPGTPVSSTLFDAMIAIERAEASNPAAAQNAAFSYNIAIQQYNAHEYERARASALTAISQSGAPAAPIAPVAHAPMVAHAFPGPRYYIIPDELPATPANAQRYVVLAHRAMASCAALKTAAAEYRGALSALSAKQYRVAMADSRNIVDDCTAR